MKNESINYLVRELGDIKVHTGVVLGSGLNDMMNSAEILFRIPYENIPGFPKSTVSGHEGAFILSRIENITVLAAKGRFHYYEGYEMDELLSIIDVFIALDIKHVIITNAAGLINSSYRPGDILMIENGIDISRNISHKDLHLAEIRENEKALIKKAEKESGISIGRGVYVWTTGPSYETPAEINFLKSIGGDLVGMSTLPEMVHARKNGLSVYPFSCATNWAAGISKTPLTHEEVNETASRVKKTLTDFIKTLCKKT